MIKRMLEIIKNAKGIILAAHVNPDGDAIGSLVGMALICEFFQKPYVVLLEQIPERFKMLLESIYVASQAEGSLYDTFVALDCGDAKRLGSFEKLYEQSMHTLCIDHHRTNEAFAEFNFIEGDASSTCELVFSFVKEAGCPLTPHLAAALYTGILTDTGGFMHSCTKPSTHEVVAQLMSVPFDFTGIYYHNLCEKTEAACHLEAAALNHLEKIRDGKCFISYLTPEDLEAAGACKDDIGGVVTYLKQIKGCEIAALLYVNGEESYKLSLRSNPPYDVAKLASKFGGGGHTRASGATLNGSLEELLRQVKESLLNEW